MASIHRREAASGPRYVVRWRDLEGKQRARTFTRKRLAEAFLAQVTVDLNDGSYVDPSAGRRLFGDYAEEWFSQRANWRDSTMDRQRSVYRNHLAPAFAHRPMGRIMPSEVRRWFSGLDLADSTRVGVLNLLSSILEQAVFDRVISVNPAKGKAVTRPKVQEDRRTPLTVDQVRALRDAAPERLRAAVTLAAVGGLRQGELFGVTVDRVGPEQIRIDRQLLTPSKGAPVFGPPKRQASFRTVHLPAFAMTELGRHLERFGEGPDRLVFTNSAGRPWRRNTANEAFQRMARSAKVDSEVATGWHALRHHCATLLIGEGVSVTGVATQLGHSPDECLRTYAHLWPGEKDRVKAAIESAWSSAPASVPNPFSLGRDR